MMYTHLMCTKSDVYQRTCLQTSSKQEIITNSHSPPTQTIHTWATQFQSVDYLIPAAEVAQTRTTLLLIDSKNTASYKQLGLVTSYAHFESLLKRD